MTLTLQWTDDDSVVRTWTVIATGCSRVVNAESKEIPIRGRVPVYISLGFTGPIVTLKFMVSRANYVVVSSMHADILVTVTSADTYYPELPSSSTWYVISNTINKAPAGFEEYECELKLGRKY